MNFGELVDKTNSARRDTPVVVVVDGEDLDVAGVDIEMADLDAGKKISDILDPENKDVYAEGSSREQMVVRLTLAP